MKVPSGNTEAVVIGASAGGMLLIKEMIKVLPDDTVPIIVVQHVADLHEEMWIRHLAGLGAVQVKEADEKEPILPGTVYLAPGNYHLLVEPDRTFGLSTDPKVNFARPSINVLFETAAEVYGQGLLAVVLSGGNADGATGVVRVKESGGMVIVQDPDTAEAPFMPRAAMEAVRPDLILSPQAINRFLSGITSSNNMRPQ